MKTILGPLGTISGALGVLISLAAIAGRFYGGQEFVGFQAISVFIVGIAFMVFGCFLKLEAGAR
jgi:hypothetical protein